MAIQDYFDYPVAYNPTAEGGGALVPDAEFQVYAIDDTSYANPLTVTEPVSGATITPLKSSSVGVLPSFRVAGDLTEVVVRSGPFVTRMASKFGALREAGFDPEQVQSAIASGAAAASAQADAEKARDDALAAAAVLRELAENQGAPLAPNPARPGTFIILNPAALVEDPARPGTFKNGVTA